MRKKFLVSISLLAVGLGVYVFFRSEVLFLYPLQHMPLIRRLHIPIDDTGQPIVYFVLYCLPDALWYLALLVMQGALLTVSRVSRMLYIFSVLLPFLLEYMQYMGIIRGTYDCADVATYLFTLLIYMLWKRRNP